MELKMMRNVLLAGLLALALLLAACGGSNAASSGTITMGSGQFTGTTDITIKVGGTVKFDDTNGGPHNLVTGANGTFSSESGAPGEFVASGIAFSAGMVQTITFPTAGTYHITCTLHPSMQATITVTAQSGGNGY
jgi:plastocyanin